MKARYKKEKPMTVGKVIIVASFAILIAITLGADKWG